MPVGKLVKIGFLSDKNPKAHRWKTLFLLIVSLGFVLSYGNYLWFDFSLENSLFLGVFANLLIIVLLFWWHQLLYFHTRIILGFVIIN